MTKLPTPFLNLLLAVSKISISGWSLLNYLFRYFDDDDEPVTPALAYIPAPGSPTNEATCSKVSPAFCNLAS